MIRGLHSKLSEAGIAGHLGMTANCGRARQYLRAVASVSLLLAPIALAALAGPAHAQDAKAFYVGKTLKLIVGLPPGGGAEQAERARQPVGLREPAFGIAVGLGAEFGGQILGSPRHSDQARARAGDSGES